MAQRETAGSYRPIRRKKKNRKGYTFGAPTSGQSGLQPINAPKPPSMGLAPTPGLKTPSPGQAAPVQPLDPDVVNAQVVAKRNVGLGDLYATWNQGNLDQDFGFGAGGAANPYSKAKLLEENFRRSKLGTLNSYAGAGKRNTGLYGASQNENVRQYDIDYDLLRRDYDRLTGENQLNRLQTYADAGTGVDDTKFASLLKQLGGL